MIADQKCYNWLWSMTCKLAWATLPSCTFVGTSGGPPLVCLSKASASATAPFTSSDMLNTCAGQTAVSAGSSQSTPPCSLRAAVQVHIVLAHSWPDKGICITALSHAATLLQVQLLPHNTLCELNVCTEQVKQLGLCWCCSIDRSNTATLRSMHVAGHELGLALQPCSSASLRAIAVLPAKGAPTRASLRGMSWAVVSREAALAAPALPPSAITSASSSL